MIRSPVRTLPALVTSVLLTMAVAASSTAQIVPIRTVPVASGDQFLMLPGQTLGMGGVHIAVDDSLADPWSNPAKGVLIDEPAFLGAPTFYSISDRGGAGKTFPLAGLFRGPDWFGGVALALQHIDNDNNNGGGVWIDPWVMWEGPARRLSDLSSRNLYARGFVGRSLSGGPWSLGVGFAGAHLDAVDGVDLLYAGADRIEQSGSTTDVRVGLYRTGERDRIAIVGLHNRVQMTHDVTYVDVFWPTPLPPQIEPPGRPIAQPRTVVNEDKTRTWGAQVAWDHDLRTPGWRIGSIFTLNHKSHPKIPNYEIQNIPRDPGTTWAYEAGFGLARNRGGTTFGLDVVFQPIWSETWQEADERVVISGGTVIDKGGRTIENDFFFTNVILRVGLSHELDEAVGLQAGLEARSYDYELEQVDHVEGTFRDQRESWMEWTPSLGAVFRFSDLELRYAGRLTTGTGQPGIAPSFDDALSAEAGRDFIVAPEGPLTLQDASVVTHQFSVRIPVR